jgi:hypothetical protein
MEVTYRDNCARKQQGIEWYLKGGVDLGPNLTEW